MRLPTAVLALLPLLCLPACKEPPPTPDALCDMAVRSVASRVGEGLLARDLVCTEATADGDTGAGQAVVAITTLRAAPNSGRIRELQRLAVPLKRGDDGWVTEPARELDEGEAHTLLPGVPLDREEDPARLAGDVEVPEALNAWQVPSIWFALPLEPGGEVERSWALGLADRADIEAPADEEAAELTMEQRIAAAVGVVGEIERAERRGSIFGGAEGPHWTVDTSWLLRDAPGLAVVTIASDGLWLGALPMAGLTGGRLHEDSLRGQLVGPLYDELNALRDGIRRASELSGEELPGDRLLVVASGDVPADTLHRVAFTARQARFGDLFLLVRDSDPMPAHQAVASLRGSGTSVVLELEPGRLLAGRRGARSTPTDDPVGFVRGQRPAGVIATSRGVDVAAVAGLLDAAHSESPGCVAWHAPIPEPPASGPAPAVPAARPLPPKSDVVSVLPWILPLIGEGPCSTAGRSGGGVGLAAGGPTILGTLDEQEIRSVVDSHRSALRTCQRSGLARGLGAAEVTVKFVVATSGAVSSARIRRSTLGDERVEDCIRERFGRMQFPPPPGGGITIVHWPLELGR